MACGSPVWAATGTLRCVALYRKYRPATFAEVVGQEHVTEPLSRALDSGRINHAYLFSGPRGCGKTSSARILARSLNCLHGPTASPCGQCPSCIALGPGGAGSLDVIELDAASHGGVDDTRDLRDKAFYAPVESRYRVFIIDEAHMVSPAGFNALLKIVEEPPEHLIFIFATTEPEKVLPTIRSRTHHYPFRLLPPPVMRGLLERICAEEQVQIEDAVYPLVIRAGGGSPRDSLSVLDQLLAGAGPDGITYQRALMLLGATDIALIDDAVDALAADDGAALYETVHRVIEAGHDPRRFAGDLLDRIRDLILLQAVPDGGERGLIDAPADVLARMQDEVDRIGAATLTRYAEIIHDGLGQMRGATAPRLLLEVMCARMLLPEIGQDQAALLQRLERLESGSAPAGGAPAASAPRPSAPEETDTAAAPGGGGDGGAPRFVRPSQRARIEAEQARQAEQADSAAQQSAAPAPAAAPEPPAPAAQRPETEAPAQEQPTDSTPPPAEREMPEASAGADSTAAPSEPAEPQPAATATPPTPAAPVERAAPVAPAEAPLPPAAPTAPTERADQVAPPTQTPEPADEPDASAPTTPAPAAAEAAPPAPPEPVAPAAAEEPAVAGPDAVAVRAAWSEVRARVREISRTLEVMLSGATVRRAEDHVLGLSHPAAPLAARLGEEHHSRAIAEAMGAVFGGTWRVVMESDSGPAPAGGAPSAPAPERSEQPRAQFVRPSQSGGAARPADGGGQGPSHGQTAAPAQQDGAPRQWERPSGGPLDTGGDSSAPSDDPGLPPEPDPYDDPYADQYPPQTAAAPADQTEDEMMAEAAAGPGTPDTAARRDPEEVAIELLESELGAQRIDG